MLKIEQDIQVQEQLLIKEFVDYLDQVFDSRIASLKTEW